MQKIFLAFACVLLIACDSQDSINSSKQTKEIGETPRPTLPTIKLYAVDPMFYKYMPDTNRVFKDSEELREYFFAISKALRNFSDSILNKASNGDSMALARKQAGILFDDLMEVVYMKFYKNSKRDNQSIMMLGAFSPHSRIISLQERISFFKTFPTGIQNNEIGKKTWEKFEEYLFDRNINLNFHEFDGVEITDPSNKRSTVKNIFKPTYKYYVLVFGASWCHPCRLEELQLKYWFNAIDTSQINIVGFSIDKNIDKWKKYLEEDKFGWDSYLLQGEMDNSMIKDLQFEGIPRNFLLDSNGKIIAENTDIRKILKAIPILQTE